VLISRGWNWIQAIISLISNAFFLIVVWYFLSLIGGATALFCAHIVSGLNYFALTAFAIAFAKPIS
jgi:hypothetical protein